MKSAVLERQHSTSAHRVVNEESGVAGELQPVRVRVDEGTAGLVFG